ncbi:MAG: hypothetical protein DRP35_04835 [Candidatus Zixiibacteriota bacterium]|nr:MAG: hypothetical protein DRP35_04835 [candidate division Zixibacteria bacterium]
MKLLKLVLILFLTSVLYDWINSCGGHSLSFSDLLPFSRTGHSYSFNYIGLVMVGLTIWCIRRIYGGRSL